MVSKVVIALDPETAKKYVEQGYIPIEASYGSVSVVDDFKLDHHGKEFRDLPNPAKRAQKSELFGKGKGYYVLSHVDLDAVLTIAGLEGIKVDPDLIAIASKIDLEGPHSVDWTKSEFANFLEAFWSATGRLRFSNEQDVTDLVNKLLEIIKNAKKLKRSKKLKQKVAQWGKEIEKAKQEVVKVEKIKVGDEVVRVGLAKGSSLAGFEGFYKVADIVVSYHTELKKITVASSKPKFSALLGPDGLLVLVPELDKRFGKGWGGRNDIIGSPRGQTMDDKVADEVFQILVSKLKQIAGEKNA